MIVNIKDLTRKSLCPSIWEGITEQDEEINITFRVGKLTVKIDGRLYDEAYRNDFDVSSYIDFLEALELVPQLQVPENVIEKNK